MGLAERVVTSDGTLLELTEEQRVLLAYEQDMARIRGRWDYDFFLFDVMGYDPAEFCDPGSKKIRDEYAKHLMWYIQNWKTLREPYRIIVIVTRGTGKTSTIIKPTIPLLTLHDPDIAGFIMTGSQERVTVPLVKSLRNIFEGTDENSRLTELYGEFYDPKRTWTTEELVIAHRKKMHKQFPTVRGYAVETGGTSGHFRVGLIDDPITEQSVEKYGKKASEKAYREHLRADPLLDKNALYVIAATRKGPSDLIGRIIKTEIIPEIEKKLGKLPEEWDGYTNGIPNYVKFTNKLSKWNIIYGEVDTDVPAPTEEDPYATKKVYNFPEIWPKDKVLDTRAKGSEGELYYATELKQRPRERADAPVTADMFDLALMPIDQFPPQVWTNMHLLCDTAWKSADAYAKQSGDWNVMYAIGIHDGQIYVAWDWHGRVMQEGWAREFQRALQWASINHPYKPKTKFKKMAVDKPTGAQGTNKQYYIQKAHENVEGAQTCPKIVEISRNAVKGKDNYIMGTGIFGMFQNNAVHIADHLDTIKELKNEILDFGPYSDYDDHIDCLSQAMNPEIYKSRRRYSEDEAHLKRNRWTPRPAVHGDWDWDSGKFVPQPMNRITRSKTW